jgi:3-dehydroquinate synthase
MEDIRVQRININSSIRNYCVNLPVSLDNIIKLCNKENAFVVIDSNVYDLYPQLLTHNNYIKFICTEELKNLDGVNVILSEFIKRKINKKTEIIAVGGGILQDVVGFCASIYHRGINYSLVPTTLLSQVDSCIGGKTSLNYRDGKNLLGTFYPPAEIYICTEFTKTLSRLDYISGLGEVYKFHILQNKIKDFNIEKDALSLIQNSLEYKANVISKDEFDTGLRRTLNFGHTFGHALEVTSNHQIPQGIAIIIGSIIAINVSIKLGFTVPDYNDIIAVGKALIQQSGIGNIDKEWLNSDRLMAAVKLDKKSTGNLTMALINEHPIITEIQDTNLVIDVIQNYYESF